VGFFDLTKDDGTVTVGKDAVFEVRSHGAGEYNPFEIFALPDQIGDFITVADTYHVLLNDRPFIEVCRHVVRGRADDFDAACVGAMVGLGSGKGREEGVVDVKGFRELCDELVAEDLHVFGEDDEIDVVGGEEFEFVGFLLVFGVGADGDVVKVDAVLVGDRLEVGMVTDDQWDFGLEFARSRSPK
jgi:hypothetical protein